VAKRTLPQDGRGAPDSIFSLLPPGAAGSRTVRQIAVDRIAPHPRQPRSVADEQSLDELKSSINEHGVVQPILLRETGEAGRYEVVAGERRWRAVVALGLPLIPALVEELSDEQALEISVIENLQREDLSPLDEAAIFARMTTELGYSIRRLAERLGKDKGYVENRLRLVAAPADVRALVATRSDTISHAYELMKIDDPARRGELADQVARGDLPLARLKAIVRGESLRDEPRARVVATPEPARAAVAAPGRVSYAAPGDPGGQVPPPAATGLDETSDLALGASRAQVADAIEGLAALLHEIDQPQAGRALSAVDRENMAKWLQIARNKLDNLAAILRQKGE